MKFSSHFAVFFYIVTEQDLYKIYTATMIKYNLWHWQVLRNIILIAVGFVATFMSIYVGIFASVHMYYCRFKFCLFLKHSILE